MKVLTINWDYAIGSTGKIILDIEKELSDIDFIHLYEYYGESNRDNVIKISGRIPYRLYLAWARISGRKYDTGIIPTAKVIRVIKKEKPDAVHIHCPNASSINLFTLLNYLKKKHIRTIITNHAEFFYTGSCPHAYECTGFQRGCGHCPDLWRAESSYFIDHTAASWRKMRNAFSGFDEAVMVAVSPWQLGRMELSPIMEGVNKTVIYNGVDTNVFRYKSKEERKLRKYDFDGKYVILLVTAHFSMDKNDPKGGYYFAEVARRLLSRDDIVFVVAGGGSREGDIPGNLFFTGEIYDSDELSELYSRADLSVVTGRRETFGMTVAESLCCGTPVVGFCNGGSESIAMKEYSYFIEEYGDVDALFTGVTERLAVTDEDSRKRLSDAASRIYSKSLMARRYKELYEGKK